jgi:glycosyltransferase involved in cell wall biosynthesis
MRIAQVAPLAEAVPPKLYGGTERVVSYLTEELVALGHDVTLFASGDSATAGKLHATWPRALRLDHTTVDPIAPIMLQLEAVREQSAAFDILHFHIDYFPASLFARQATPFLTTLHGRLDMPELRPVFRGLPPMPVVSISDRQREPLPEAQYIATIHHGLPDWLLTPREVTPSYLAFLGRISPEKGAGTAIEIARAAGLPLKIAAKIANVDREYYETMIRPLIGGDIELVGEISETEKSDFLSGALALLTPVNWPEPFGLVMIEAMACGSPVIAFRRGSIPEVMTDGVTGYVVDDVPGAVAAIGRLGALSRKSIRAEFEQRFTARRMTQDYLEVYDRLLAARQLKSRRVAAGD